MFAVADRRRPSPSAATPRLMGCTTSTEGPAKAARRAPSSGRRAKRSTGSARGTATKSSCSGHHSPRRQREHDNPCSGPPAERASAARHPSAPPEAAAAQAAGPAASGLSLDDMMWFDASNEEARTDFANAYSPDAAALSALQALANARAAARQAVTPHRSHPEQSPRACVDFGSTTDDRTSTDGATS